MNNRGIGAGRVDEVSEIAWNVYSRYRYLVAKTRQKQSAEDSYDMSPEDVVAVKEGMADFANGRVLTEEQFEAEMNRFMERRRAEIEALRVAR